MLHSCNNQWGKIKGRQYGITVSAVNACRLNMLHHSHHVKIFSVIDGIDLCFLATVKEVIDQYFISGNMLQQADDGFFKVLVIDDDTHSLTTEYITGTNKHRISYTMCHFNGIIYVEGCTIIRIRNLQFFQHIA